MSPPANRDASPLALLWAILRVLAPVLIVLGVAGVFVGLAAGQAVGIVLVDAMVVAVGVVLLLTLRWRR